MEDDRMFLIVLTLRANDTRSFAGKTATTTSLLVEASSMAAAIGELNPGDDCIRCEITEVIYNRT